MNGLITTARLQMRPLQARDLDALHSLYSDPSTMQFIGDGSIATRQETAEALLVSIDAFEQDGYGLLATLSRDSGRMIGRCGHKRWTVDGEDHVEIGWMIHADHCGEGLATEAGFALRDYAFDALDLDHVISVVQPGNDASIRVAEKVGETYWRKWKTPRGQDVVIYRVDRR